MWLARIGTIGTGMIPAVGVAKLATPACSIKLPFVTHGSGGYVSATDGDRTANQFREHNYWDWAAPGSNSKSTVMGGWSEMRVPVTSFNSFIVEGNLGDRRPSLTGFTKIQSSLYEPTSPP